MWCKTGPDLIWMAWSGQMHLAWKQASVHESSGLVLAECNAHYQFTIFRFNCVLSQTAARIILHKISPFPIWFRLTASGFRLNRSGPEAGQSARITGPASGPCLWADPDRMWIRSGVFTGPSIPVYFMCSRHTCEQTDPDLHSLGRVVDKGDPDDLGLGVDKGADVGVEDLDVHAQRQLASGHAQCRGLRSRQTHRLSLSDTQKKLSPKNVPTHQEQ